MLRAAVLLVGLAAGGCAALGDAPPAAGPLQHIVLIKLLDPELALPLVTDSLERLGRVPTVATLSVGRHVDIGRTGIDGDYSVGIVVSFDSRADYEAYLAHPEHVALVEQWRPHFDWIRIHDVGPAGF